MDKWKSQKDKPIMVTLSWGECDKHPRCKGCYLETLKTQRKARGTRWTSFLDNSLQLGYNIDVVFANICSVTDIERINTRLNNGELGRLLAQKIAVKVIIPINMIFHPGITNLPPNIGKVVSINTFDPYHIYLLRDRRMIRKKLPTLKYELEVSFNRSTLSRSGIRNLCMQEIPKIKEHNPFISDNATVTVNYVPTEKDPKISEIMKHMSNISTQIGWNPPDRISPCLWAALGGPKPCDEYHMMEFIDDKLAIEGCPYIGVQLCGIK